MPLPTNGVTGHPHSPIAPVPHLHLPTMPASHKTLAAQHEGPVVKSLGVIRQVPSSFPASHAFTVLREDEVRMSRVRVQGHDGCGVGDRGVRSRAEPPGDVGGLEGASRTQAGIQGAKASQDRSIPDMRNGAVHEAKKLVLTPKNQKGKAHSNGNRLMQKSLETLCYVRPKTNGEGRKKMKGSDTWDVNQESLKQVVSYSDHRTRPDWFS